MKTATANGAANELDFGITTRGGWYKPYFTFGTRKITPMHEHDSSRTTLGKIVIMPRVPDGAHQLYIWGYPVFLYVQEGQQPSLSLSAQSHWANSQNWHYREFDSTTLQKGWVFVNGQDVYESTIETVKKNHAAKVANRNAKFEELSKVVTERYDAEVLKLVLRKKGSVLAILKVLSESLAQVEIGELKRVLGLSSSAPVIANLLVCVAGGLDPFGATKVAKKAYAWAYLSNALPGVDFIGYFDDAKAALELYGQHWAGKVFQNKPAQDPTESDFAFLLRMSLKK